MQVGVSHLVAGDWPLEQFFKRASAAGYEVVELMLRREGELTLKTSKDDLKRIAELAKMHKLSLVSMVHCQLTGNILDSGQAQRTGIEETIAGLEVARTLGIGCTLHTLGRLRADLFYDDAYRNAVAALKEIAKAAEKLDVVLAAEFVWSGFLFSPLEYRHLLDEVGSSHVGFYFDPGNMAIFQFPQHWARILGKHIRMVHMKDWKGGPLNGGWPPLLKGTVDYAAINRELRAAGYDGPMISEVPPGDAPLEETAAAIRKIIAM